MDSVRFGRALGMGARLAAKTAAKTLVSAADAAAAPNPSSPRRQSPSQSSAPSSPPPTPKDPPLRRPQAVSSKVAQTAADLRSTSRGIARGSRRFGQAAWGPVAKLSGVLWLELTGVFFGLFALFAGIGAWKLRGNLHRSVTNPEAHTHLELAAAMALLFGYFCISSFIRASRRGRRS